MKKIILSISILLMGIAGAKAQTAFGIKAGLNVSNITGDTEGLKSRIGANGGVFANIPAGQKFAIQPEVLYSLEGAKGDGNDAGKIALGYVNIPVMFQYREKSGFFAELGPQLGILTSAKVKYGGESEDVKDAFKSINFSAAVGVGYNFIPSLGVNARYSFGVSNIVEESGEDKARTSNFSVGLHYNFGK